MPWWGWVLLVWLALAAVATCVWAVVTDRRHRSRTDWLAGLERRVADPVDEACADWRAALAPDGSHDRYPHMTEECRQVYIDFCESMWRSDIERSTT